MWLQGLDQSFISFFWVYFNILLIFIVSHVSSEPKLKTWQFLFKCSLSFKVLTATNATCAIYITERQLLKTVTLKWRTAIKVLLLYFNLCLLDSKCKIRKSLVFHYIYIFLYTGISFLTTVKAFLFVGTNFRGFYKMHRSMCSWISGFKHYRQQSMGKL
jgi:hypothetical protein